MSKFRTLAHLWAPAFFCLTASVAMCQNVERRVVKALAPPYHDVLLQARFEGTARLEVRVAPSGEVEDVKVTKPFFTSEWSEGYLQYAREWRFEPGETSTTEQIIFKFRFVPRDSSPTEQGTVFIAPATVEIRHLRPGASVIRSYKPKPIR